MHQPTYLPPAFQLSPPLCHSPMQHVAACCAACDLAPSLHILRPTVSQLAPTPAMHKLLASFFLSPPPPIPPPLPTAPRPPLEHLHVPEQVEQALDGKLLQELLKARAAECSTC